MLDIRFKNPILLWSMFWLIAVVAYGLILHYKFYITTADHVVYGIQLIGDAFIGVFGFLAYKHARSIQIKRFLFVVFLSICVGLFANEVYNLLFNIIGIKTTNALINDLWLVPYTLFLVFQIFGWFRINYFTNEDISINKKTCLVHAAFLQAVVFIVLSIVFTTSFKRMFTEQLGYVQIGNTLLEMLLFFILSISLAKSKTRFISYLASGFLLLLAFNLAHRFSYMSGYYYKTFYIAWLISFVFIIYGLFFAYKDDIKTVDMYEYDAIHVVSGSILMVFTSILFILFVTLEFFITSLETNNIGHVKLLIENLPSILIFSFTGSIILSKLIAEKASAPFEKISKRIQLIENENKNVSDMPEGNYTINEAKKLDEFILGTLNRLHIANKAKSEFLMNMSHDFRTPASGIYSMSKLIYRKLDNDDHKRLQHLVVDSSRQLLGLLDDVLEHSRLDYNLVNVEKEKVNIVQLINDVLLFMSAKFDEKGIDLIFEQRGKEIYADIDITLINRVLINLLANAVKFTEKGLVKIEIRSGLEDEMHISIEDSGIGIPADKCEAIFEPFVRVESSETSKYPGIGLGLSNVRLMVQALGGKISVSSKLGKGSKFTLILYPS